MKESKGKEAFKKPFLFLGLAFVALGCTLGFSSLAWFATPATSATVTGMEGEATGSYFESGIGTESDPYIIANAKQLYYFAWLQDMGFFNTATTTVTSEDGSTKPKIQTTYFKIKDGLTTIDASAYTLPPIGIEKYPFVGNFNANNCTITGLTISNKIGTGYIEEGKYPTLLDTDNTRLTKDEFNSTSQASIVGFFGIIGQYNSIPSATYDSDANEVKNLYLDEITIKTTDKSNLLIGIFAGYVNGIIDNCGVHYAKMNINGATSKISAFNYVSEYTLIGSYNKDKYKWDQDTTSGGSGSDTGYGTSTDIKSLHVSLINNGLKDSTGTVGQIPLKTVLPFRYANTTLIQGTGESKTITAVKNYGSKTLTINPSEYSTYEASSKGNNLGYYSGVVETIEQALDYNVSDFGSGYNLKTPPDNVLTYLEKNGTHLLRFTSGKNAQYLKDLDFAYVENAIVGSTKGNLLIPTDGIWVAPKESGKFRFVFYNPGYADNKTVGVYFWILKRITVGDYSSTFDGYNSFPSMSPYSCKYGYFEYSASTEYEYFIGFSTSGNYSPYIAYMDIGVENGEGDGGADTDTRTLITNFDFVTKENNVLTKIKNADGTAIEGNTYTKSDIFFEIDDTSTTRTFAWRRTTVDGTVTVLYYDSVSTTVVTAIGDGNKKTSSDENCNS